MPPQVVLTREGLAPLPRVCAGLFGTVVPPCLLVLVVDVAVKMGLGAEPLTAIRTLTDVRSIVIPFMVTVPS